MHAIEITAEAAKALRRMPCNIAALIPIEIDMLAANPYAPNNNVKKLKGSDNYRLCVGDWRVIYALRNDVVVITVVRITPRGGAYD